MSQATDEKQRQSSLKNDISDVIKLLESGSSSSFWSKSQSTDIDRAMIKLGQITGWLSRGQYSLENLIDGSPSIKELDKFKGQKIEAASQKLQEACAKSIQSQSERRTTPQPNPTLITLS